MNESNLHQHYFVTGMTCSHCEEAVRKELAAIPGIVEVTIEIVPGGLSKLAISGSAAIADGDVERAIEEAGYELAP